MSHQPVSGPRTRPLGAGHAAAGLAVPDYSASAAGVGVPPVSRVAVRRGNLPAACLSGLAAAIVLGAGSFGYVAWMGSAPWWLFLLLGAGTGAGTYRGNGYQITGSARLAATLLGLLAALAFEYAAYRHLAIQGLRGGGNLPAVLTRNQITFLFTHAPGEDWRLLALICAAAAALSRPGWAGKGNRR